VAGWLQLRARAVLAEGRSAATLSPGSAVYYVMLYAAAIVFFCFFYTALVFNPRRRPTT
jgi:preprotein translocase subunit SecY